MTPEQAVARRQLARIVDALTTPSTSGGAASAPPAPVTADATMLAVARNQRAVPFLARAVRDGLALADTTTTAEIEEAWNLAMRRCLVMEERIVWLHGELTARGVEMRILKGSASAHLDHRGPELRDFGDIDVLVPGHDMPAVDDLFTREGFARSHRTPNRRYGQRFIKSATFRADVEFDVHRTLTDNPLGHRIQVDDLWTTSTPFSLGTTTVHALPAELRFVHACLHAYLSRPPMRLSTLADLLALVRRPDLDHDLALEMARQWGVHHVITAAVNEAVAQVAWPTDVHLGYVDADSPSITDAALVAAHRSTRSSSTVQTLLSLVTLPDTRTRIALIRSLLFASRQYRADHRRPVRTAAGHLARALGTDRTRR